MPKPTEYRSVQVRILKYSEAIGWEYVSRNEAEKRRGFSDEFHNIQEKAKTANLYFADILYEKVKNLMAYKTGDH